MNAETSSSPVTGGELAVSCFDVVMETVGEYRPISGLNHFRRASEKYEHLEAGDVVTVNFVPEAGAEVPTVTVSAQVAYVVRGKLDELLEKHWKENAAMQPWGHHTQGALLGILADAYGDISLDDDFIVVGFA